MAGAVASVTVVDDNGGSARTNTVFSAPSGITDGDVLVCIMHTGSNPVRTVTAPAGWNPVTNFPHSMTSFGGDPYIVRAHAFIKVASGESGSYTFSHSSANSEGIMYRCTGIDTTTPVSPTPTVDNHTSSTGGNSVTAPTITTPVNDSVLLWWGAVWDGFGNASPPSGTTPTFTERANDTTGVFYSASGVLATAGATGAKVVTVSQGDNRPYLGGMICLQAASGSSVTLAGTVDGISTTASVLGVSQGFAGSATGQSTANSVLGVSLVFAGSATALSTTNAYLTLPVLFAGAVAGASTTTANFVLSVGLAGAVSGVSTAASDVRLSQAFAGAVSGLSGVDGILGVSRTFAGAATGQSDVAAAPLAVGRNFAGSASGVSTTAGVLGVSFAFAGSVTGNSTAVAAFAGDVSFAASVSGTSSTTAALAVNQAFAASVTGTTSATANLERLVGFAGSATGLSTVSSNLGLGVSFAASATGSSTAVAALGLQLSLAAAATGSSGASANLALAGEVETTPGPYRTISIDVFSPGLVASTIFTNTLRSSTYSARSEEQETL